MNRRSIGWAGLLWIASLSACGGGNNTGSDGSSDGREVGGIDSAAEAGGPCRSNADCIDTVFCNGEERCAPMEPGANARGCVAAATGPCAAGTGCNESTRMCGGTTEGGIDAPSEGGNCDMDGDGARAISCGGTDCDDNDRLRFPGNMEICDGMLSDGRSATGHDEDCNPCTVSTPATADGDADRDGYPRATCVNPWVGGVRPVGCDEMRHRVDTMTMQVRGADCNDDPMMGGADVRPNQMEQCNGIDDNCNGQADDVDPAATTACGTAPFATLRCAGTACATTCTPGRLNCDGVAANGCETDPQADPLNCGGCGTRCSTMGGSFNCVSGVCRLSMCAPGSGDCDGNVANGCETNTTSDTRNCGFCGNVCSGSTICSSGMCACTAGQTNCGGTCRSLATDNSNCGACGRVCATTLVGSTCQSGTCTCAAGQTACPGACRNLTSDVSNCGACGRVCTAATGGTATCTGGTCGTTCPAGQGVCGTRCQPIGGCSTSALGCSWPGTWACNSGTSTATCNGAPPAGACTNGSTDTTCLPCMSVMGAPPIATLTGSRTCNASCAWNACQSPGARGLIIDVCPQNPEFSHAAGCGAAVAGGCDWQRDHGAISIACFAFDGYARTLPSGTYRAEFDLLSGPLPGLATIEVVTSGSGTFTGMVPSVDTVWRTYNVFFTLGACNRVSFRATDVGAPPFGYTRFGRVRLFKTS